MKSPFTGGEVILRYERRKIMFRKEMYEYTHGYYVCVDTGEEFTTTELDEVNLIQVYNQYRVKYGIPFPDEMKSIRHRYGVSALAMARILGMGENQYRLYENGEMPTVSIGRMISSIRNKETFANILEEAKGSLEENEYQRILNKLRLMRPEETEWNLGDSKRSIDNGYARVTFGRVKNTILYFLEKCGDVGYTKMNKLLFYADFTNYRLYGTGITGLQYMAIQYGPVPVNWTRIYNSFDDIEVKVYETSEGERYEMHPLVAPDLQSFSAEELGVLEDIAERFGKLSAKKLTEISHKESGWINNQETHHLIPYSYAFALNPQQ